VANYVCVELQDLEKSAGIYTVKALVKSEKYLRNSIKIYSMSNIFVMMWDAEHEKRGFSLLKNLRRQLKVHKTYNHRTLYVFFRIY
jgi:hypothetical protein